MRPWRLADAVGSGVFAVIGVVLAVVGWYVASGRATTDGQLGPSTVAVLGLVAAGIGGAWWVRAGRRAVATRTQLLLGEAPSAAALERGRPRDSRLVAAEGLRFYHRADCPFADAAWPARSASAHQKAGRVPCGVCRP